MRKVSALSRFVWLVSFLSICLTSCNNDSDDDNNVVPDEEYYVRFKVNGVQKDYKSLADVMLNEKNSGGLYQFSMVGLENFYEGGTTNNLTLSILDPEPVASQVEYTNYAPTSGEEERVQILILTYLDEAGVAYTALGDEFAILGVISDSKTTITEITETAMKGTFSGTLYNIDRTKTVEITEGEFWADFY